MKEKKAKFDMKAFMKENKGSSNFYERYNDNLKIYHSLFLEIKDYEKISNRLFKVQGTYKDTIKFEDDSVKEKFIEGEFILDKINVEPFFT